MIDSTAFRSKRSFVGAIAPTILRSSPGWPTSSDRMKGCRGSSADNCPLVTRAARGINHLGSAGMRRSQRPGISLLTRVSLVNMVVFGAAGLVLVITPATLSPPADLREGIVLLAG